MSRKAFAKVAKLIEVSADCAINVVIKGTEATEIVLDTGVILARSGHHLAEAGEAITINIKQETLADIETSANQKKK